MPHGAIAVTKGAQAIADHLALRIGVVELAGLLEAL
jgi:hypothetical protein